jgi:hypothetical protein
VEIGRVVNVWLKQSKRKITMLRRRYKEEEEEEEVQVLISCDSLK